MSKTLSVRIAAGLLTAAVLPLAACSSALEVTIPDTLVEPGSTVAIGETVLVPGTAYRDNHLTDADVALTIAKVEFSDESFFEKLANPEDFAGYTPVLIASQVDVDPDSDLTRPGSSGPWGILSDGEYAEYLTLDRFASSDKFCWSSTYSPASTDLGCTVLLVPDGETLETLVWNGQKANSMGINVSGLGPDDPTQPYLDNPLLIAVPTE